MSVTNPEGLVDFLVAKMRGQAEEAGVTRAVVGVSGGVDSAVVAALACRAFGADNVLLAYVSVHSTGRTAHRAETVAQRLETELWQFDASGAMVNLEVEIQISGIAPTQTPADDHKAVLRSCLRAAVLRFLTHYPEPALLMGTGNRDEDELLRFYQKGGDGAVDNNWLGGLHKSEVWELAAHLNVPQEIIDAEPSPDLWGGAEHLDEAELEALTGVKLTYLRPGTGEATPDNGSIEWVTRENDRYGIVTPKGFDAFDAFPITTRSTTSSHTRCRTYSEKALKIVKAVRVMERKTRHKALPPPQSERKELLAEGLVA